MSSCPNCRSQYEGSWCPTCTTLAVRPPKQTTSLAPSFPKTSVVSRYERDGVAVIHTFQGQDAEIMDHIEATAMILQDLAGRMRGFVASDDETRRLIKETISLSADLRNEVDRRKGRQNG